MNRFLTNKKKTSWIRRLIPIIFFCAVITLLLFGLSSVSHTASAKEAESLEDAVRRSAVQCYALEGFYPDNLSYLEEHYGITYDKEKYIVSYEVVGSNMMADIMVITLNRSEEERP